MKKTTKLTLGTVVAIGVAVSASLFNKEKLEKDQDVESPSVPKKETIAYLNEKEVLETQAVEKGFHWLTDRNTLVSVPPNSIVDKNGNIVKGKVEFSIREFDDAFEAVLSNVDMEYDSLNTTYHFETGGMFDLRASQNNEPVYIKTDQHISIAKGAEELGSRFNAYFYDEEKGNWIYKGKNIQAKVHAVTAEPIETEDSLLIDKSTPLQLEFDKEDFPELDKFKEVTFYPKNVDEKTLNKLKTISWEEMKLKKNKGAYELTLMRFKEKIKIDVVPDIVLDSIIQESKEKLKVARKKNLVQIKYAEWEKGDEGLELKVKDLSFSPKRKMRGDEFSQMSFDVVNVFTVNNFGMWNCDAPSKLPKGTNIESPKFIYKKDTIDTPGTYYLSENSKSLLFKYYKGKTFQFDEKQDNVLWFMEDEEGDLMIYFAKKEDFKFEDNYMKVERIKLEYGRYSYSKIETALGI